MRNEEKKGMTVGELLDSLEKDPEYIKMREKKETERLEGIAAIQVESIPFAVECIRLGYNIFRPGNLIKHGREYIINHVIIKKEKKIAPDIISIMIKHLSNKNYSRGFRIELAVALAVPEASPHFNEISCLLQNEKDEILPFYLAQVLSASAQTQDNLDEIERLIGDKQVDFRSSYLATVRHRMEKKEDTERLKGEAAILVESIPFAVECINFGHRFSYQIDSECFRIDYSIQRPSDLTRDYERPIIIEDESLHPDLIPIMIKHLSDKNHSFAFRHELAVALVVPEASPYFYDILRLYNKEENEQIQFQLAEALAEAAQTQDALDVIERLIHDKAFFFRSSFLATVKRMEKGEQRERILEYARKEPELKQNFHIFRLR
jgi:hypothetical protein